MNNHKVNIIGAGPASLVAAINLARDGYKVTLHEQKQNAGWRFNSDYQGLENWTTEEELSDFLNSIGIFINFKCEPCHKLKVYGPNHKMVDIESKRPIYYLIERGINEWSLDQGLKRQALAEGVDIRWGSRVETVPSGWVVVGTGPREADAIAKGIVFKTSHPDVAIGFLDNKIAPKAYAYLLVSGQKATFATCMFEDFKNSRYYFDGALNVLKGAIDIDIREPKEFGGFINYFLQPSSVKSGRILYVGESAGFQDALWGFGLRYSMLSGYLAAVSIKTGIFYDELCNRHIRPYQEASLANRWIFEHLGNFGYKKLIKYMKKTDVVGRLRHFYQPTRVKKVFFQVAKRAYSDRILENQCMHENCNCVWCRQCEEESGSTHKTREKMLS